MAKVKTTTLGKLQIRVNKLIRERDSNDHGFFVCCSCREIKSTGRNINAGHFYSVGSYPFLRFYPKNIHAECVGCNCFRRDDHIHDYRVFMVEKYGEAFVEDLRKYKQTSTKLLDLAELGEYGKLEQFTEYYEELMERIKFN